VVGHLQSINFHYASTDIVVRISHSEDNVCISCAECIKAREALMQFSRVELHKHIFMTALMLVLRARRQTELFINKLFSNLWLRV